MKNLKDIYKALIDGKSIQNTKTKEIVFFNNDYASNSDVSFNNPSD
jgi:hypothetical protein